MALEFIVDHFRRYRQMSSPWSFCWKITIEGFLIGLLIGVIIYLLFSIPDSKKEPFIELLVDGVILAPSIETLLLQTLPIYISRKLKAGFRGQVLTSMIVFAIPHFDLNIAAGFSAGAVGGFYSAFTYAHWNEKSSWTAFWTTTVSHTAHNFLLFLILFFNGY